MDPLDAKPAAAASNQSDPDAITSIGTHDVLLGRGNNKNEGNIRFLALVQQAKSEYMEAHRHIEKHEIAKGIFNTILSRHGRFLRQVEPDERQRLDYTRAWAVVDEDVAVEKVKQALRDYGQKSRVEKRGPASTDSPSKRQRRSVASAPCSLASSNAGASNHTQASLPSIQTSSPATIPPNIELQLALLRHQQLDRQQQLAGLQPHDQLCQPSALEALLSSVSGQAMSQEVDLSALQPLILQQQLQQQAESLLSASRNIASLIQLQNNPVDALLRQPQQPQQPQQPHVQQQLAGLLRYNQNPLQQTGAGGLTIADSATTLSFNAPRETIQANTGLSTLDLASANALLAAGLSPAASSPPPSDFAAQLLALSAITAPGPVSDTGMTTRSSPMGGSMEELHEDSGGGIEEQTSGKSAQSPNDGSQPS